MNRKNLSKNQKKSSNSSQKAGNTQRKKGRNRSRRTNIKLNSKTIGNFNAPAAVSDDLQQFVRFGQSSDGSSLRMHVRIPLYQINSNYHDGSNLIKGGLSLSSTDSFPYAALSATTGYYAGGGSDTVKNYISPVLKFVGSAFCRYITLKSKFIYEPQSSTAISDRLVFCFANDPEHPLIKSVPSAATQSRFLALADSVAFAPWRSWELDVTQSTRLLNKDPLYIFNQDTTSELDNRFQMFGAIGCLASVEPSSTTAMTVYGILYGEFIFDFIEMDPQSTGALSLSSPITLKKLKEEGWSKKCSNLECKKCSKVCISQKQCSEKDNCLFKKHD